MILCLDVGNSHIFGGVFTTDDQLILRFRHDSKQSSTSDQLGVFLIEVLNANGIKPNNIKQIAICSVVPQIDYSLRSACIKYFDLEPFTLVAGVKTGLKIKYKNPLEVGADRIANAIAAIKYFQNRNIIVVDCGTATTLGVINKDKEFLGGVIFAGIRLSMEALQTNTAKLMSVEIVRPKIMIGRSSSENIQTGLYFSQLAAIKYLTDRITEQEFHGQTPVIVGTGGFAHLYEQDNIFTHVLPDLILHGLRQALCMNEKNLPA